MSCLHTAQVTESVCCLGKSASLGVHTAVCAVESHHVCVHASRGGVARQASRGEDCNQSGI